MKIRITGREVNCELRVQKKVLFWWKTLKFRTHGNLEDDETEAVFSNVNNALECLKNYRSYAYKGCTIYPFIVNDEDSKEPGFPKKVVFFYFDGENEINLLPFNTVEDARKSIDIHMKNYNNNVLWKGRIK